MTWRLAGTLLRRPRAGTRTRSKETQGWFAAQPRSDAEEGVASGPWLDNRPIARVLSVRSRVGTGVGVRPRAGNWRWIVLARRRGCAARTRQRRTKRRPATYFSQFYTPAQTAGILANAQTESDFNPNAANSSGHYGLISMGSSPADRRICAMGRASDSAIHAAGTVAVRPMGTDAYGKASQCGIAAQSPAWSLAQRFDAFRAPGKYGCRSRASRRDCGTDSREEPPVSKSAASQPVAPAAASGDDLTTVLKRLRKQQAATQPVNVRIYNQTAAQVHVSANAAVAQ